jgi:hypothetical protein
MNSLGPLQPMKSEPRCLDITEVPWPVRISIRLELSVPAEAVISSGAPHQPVRCSSCGRPGKVA